MQDSKPVPAPPAKDDAPSPLPGLPDVMWQWGSYDLLMEEWDVSAKVRYVEAVSEQEEAAIRAEVHAVKLDWMRANPTAPVDETEDEVLAQLRREVAAAQTPPERTIFHRLNGGANWTPPTIPPVVRRRSARTGATTNS